MHTWNQKLDVHVHLHVLVTAGGLGNAKQWIKPQKSCLLPRKVLMIKFRGKFKAMLRAALGSQKLRLPDRMTMPEMNQVLGKLNATPWNVKIHDVYGHGDGVATYLAHYIKGGPTGNSRLLDVVDARVRFRYRLRRLQAVRGYGLYSGNQHSQLSEARASLGMSDCGAEAPMRPSWQERCEAAGFLSACCCPQCGATLVSHGHFTAGRSPPVVSLGRRLMKEAA